MPKNAFAVAAAALLLLAIGFLAGLFVRGGGAPSDASRQELTKPLVTDASRQELTKRLVTTKAAIESGLTLASLGGEETQLRAAAELADRRVSDSERRAVADVIFAVHQTRSAWQFTLGAECRFNGNFYLGPDCYNELSPLVESLRLSVEAYLSGHPKWDSVIDPFLFVCLSRIQAAIDLLARG